MIRLLIVIGSFTIVAEPAYAWHPGFHLHVIRHALQHVLLPAGVIELACQYTDHFLYGTIIPDRFIGKGEIDVSQRHPQHKETAYAMLRRADEPASRALACGYLLHLRADDVAHESFLDGRVDPDKTLRHVMHELAIESYVTDEDLKILKELTQRRDYQVELLDELNLHYPLETPFQTPAFRTYLALSTSRPWRKMADMINAMSRFHVSTTAYRTYRDETIDAMNEPI